MSQGSKKVQKIIPIKVLELTFTNVSKLEEKSNKDDSVYCNLLSNV